MHDTNPHQWHLNKSVPIALICTVFFQTIGAVWWASSLNTQVTQLNATVARTVVDMETENLRQWARINTNEENVQITLSLQQTTQAILERVELGLQETRSDIRRQNDLIQKYVSDK